MKPDLWDSGIAFTPANMRTNTRNTMESVSTTFMTHIKEFDKPLIKSGRKDSLRELYDLFLYIQLCKEDFFMNTLGKNIVNLRKKAGMTQENLAQKLYTTRQTISNYETGRSEPDFETLTKIAEVFGIETGSLPGEPVSDMEKDLHYDRSQFEVFNSPTRFIHMHSDSLDRNTKSLLPK